MRISGYVFDEYDVLPGVNIWEGTKHIGTTDLDGRYTIDVISPLAVIKFSFAETYEKSFIASQLQTNPNVILEGNMLDTVNLEFDVRKKKNFAPKILGGLAALLLLVGFATKNKKQNGPEI